MLNIRNWIIIFFIPLFCLSGFAQTPPPTPTPSQRVGGTDWERKSEVQRKQDDDAWLASKKVEISTVSSPAASKPPSGLDFAKATTAMSPTAAQMKILAPSNDDLARYSAFLSQKKTGIFRIFPVLDCGDSRIIQAGSPCVDAIPLSSYYSFRKKNYSPQSLADLELRDSKLVTNGKLANGIMVSLGDVPIESITLATLEVARLTDFPFVKSEQELSARSTQLQNGIKVGDFLYSSSLPVIENNTYAIRVIAYRGLDYSRGTDPYFPLYEWDKRNDILVVFRTIRNDGSGNYTLIWKELQRKNTPKIKS
ncbi:MAG: hypothetical protein K1X72_20850 [Pyrinomonadaceae bacterium]|nr:hypothetical protein [Pyrinomonadaceae bacterium]